MFEEKATKKDLEEFGKTIGGAFGLFKKEIRGEIQKIAVSENKIKETTTGNKEIMTGDIDGFILSSLICYLGAKNPENEKAFQTELANLMKKYKVIKVNGELFKSF